MMLRELIEELRKHPPEKTVRYGFGEPRSYRGYYEDIAFEPAVNVSVGEMLSHAESAMGRVFVGYKGGEYRMDGSSRCWISEYGTTVDSQMLGPLLLKLMLA